MMSSVAKVKFILQPRSILAMYDRHLKPSFIKFKSRSQKILIFKFQYQNEKKRKNGKIFFWVTKRGIYGITNRGKFQGLQIRARGIINRGSLRDFKSGQRDFKSGQRLQIRARRISNRGRNYKLVQNNSNGHQFWIVTSL